MERLSAVKHSYHAASRTFARRYFAENHVMKYQSVKQEEENSGKNDLQKMQQVDVNALNPAILQKFLGSGLLDETEEFVKNYFRAIGTEPMQSLVFRNYVVLNVRFSVLSFLKQINAELEKRSPGDRAGAGHYQSVHGSSSLLFRKSDPQSHNTSR